MAAPLSTTKQSVDLSAPGKLGSRIRRDPVPEVKVLTLEELRERDRRGAIIGIIVFALAIFVVVLGLGAVGGWTPAQYTWNV